MKKFLLSLIVVLMGISMQAQEYIPAGWHKYNIGDDISSAEFFDVDVVDAAIREYYDSLTTRHATEIANGTFTVRGSIWFYNVNPTTGAYTLRQATWKQTSGLALIDVNYRLNEVSYLISTVDIFYYMEEPITYNEMTIAEALAAEDGSLVIVSGQVVYADPFAFVINADGRGIRCNTWNMEDAAEFHVGDIITTSGAIYNEPNGINDIIAEGVELVQSDVALLSTPATIDEINANTGYYYAVLVELTGCTYVGPNDLQDGAVEVAQGEQTIICTGFVENPSTDVSYTIMGMLDLTQEGTPFITTDSEWITAVEPSALDAVVNDQEVLKSLKNGKLIIRIGDHLYDATGAEL